MYGNSENAAGTGDPLFCEAVCARRPLSLSRWLSPFLLFPPMRHTAHGKKQVERAGTDSLLAPQSSGGIATPAKGRRCKVSGARRPGARRRSSVPSQQDSPSRMLLCSDTLRRLAAGTV